MTVLLSERSQVFDHADAYAVSDYVNKHVGHHCIALPAKGRPNASINHRAFSSLDLCRISYGAPVQVTSPALESVYHLQILLRGQCRSTAGREVRVYRAGEILLINPDDPVDLTYSADCEKFIVTFPLRVFENACLEQHWTLPPSGIRFVAGRHEPNAVGGLMPLLGLICDEAENTGSAGNAGNAEVHGLYERIVASKLLGWLGSNVAREVPGTEARGGFEPVREYVEAHVTEDISAEQLAAVARVSVRSLYGLFERHVGLSPRDYLRQRKLERVHLALKCPTTRSVTEVALDHGFLHLGRFSDEYRKRFGELPSQTRRNAAVH
jgi:AraC-like DNA-binding protein